MHSSRRKHISRRAFTMIEVIVVVVLMGVLAGMIVVRLGGMEDRQIDLQVRQVEHLLEVVAHRQLVSGDALAVAGDGEGRIWLERLFAEPGETVKHWQTDLLAPEVVIDHPLLRLESVQFNGSPALGEFREILPMDDVRPTIEVTLDWNGRECIVELMPQALRPLRWTAGTASPATLPSAVDLDAAGRGSSEW